MSARCKPRKQCAKCPWKKSTDPRKIPETARLHTEYADACARSYDHLAALLPHVAVIEHAYQQEAERGARIKTELRAALDDLPTQRPGEP